MKDRSNDPSHHERTLLPRSYISLPTEHQVIAWKSTVYLICRTEECFLLMMHSTHFIYGYMASDMVKYHTNSERGNLLLPHGLLFPINSKGSFICTIPQTGGMMHIIRKSSLYGGSEFSLLISERYFTMYLTPYNRKLNVLSASLNKTFLSFFLINTIV